MPQKNIHFLILNSLAKDVVDVTVVLFPQALDQLIYGCRIQGGVANVQRLLKLDASLTSNIHFLSWRHLVDAGEGVWVTSVGIFYQSRKMNKYSCLDAWLRKNNILTPES